MFKKEYLKNDFDFLVGKLSLENDSFKKKFIEELLRLPENEWSNIENFRKNNRLILVYYFFATYPF